MHDEPDDTCRLAGMHICKFAPRHLAHKCPLTQDRQAKPHDAEAALLWRFSAPDEGMSDT